MPIDKHVNYVEFPAKNLADTKAFFEKAFDWAFQSWGDEYIAFSNSGLDGGFYRAEKTSDSDSGAALVVLYSSEIEATQESVKSAGGVIVKEIFTFPGGRRFHFREPSGNELAVWSDK